MAEFKLGDVIRYGISKNVECIVSKDHGNDVGVCAWRGIYGNGNGDWYLPSGVTCPKLSKRMIDRHPDADRVRAEYTAWKLSQ